jgi:dsDNA-specific endonuclease/ATPase MutS2
MKRSSAEAHERNRQQALQELEQIRQEATRLQQESQAEAERLQQEALSFRQTTQQQAEALLQRSKQEASNVQQGANRYAEQVLGELDNRLQEMAKVVIAGRRELVRLQSSDIEAPIEQSNAVSINRSSGRRIGRRTA